MHEQTFSCLTVYSKLPEPTCSFFVWQSISRSYQTNDGMFFQVLGSHGVMGCHLPVANLHLQGTFFSERLQVVWTKEFSRAIIHENLRKVVPQLSVAMDPDELGFRPY